MLEVLSSLLAFCNPCDDRQGTLIASLSVPDIISGPAYYELLFDKLQ